MPVDWNLWNWGLLRGQAKERKVEFPEGDIGFCWVAFTAMLGKCQRTGRMTVPSELTLTTWCIMINGTHSYRKTLLFLKAPMLKKQPENPNVLEMTHRRYMCFLLPSASFEGFLNIPQYFLWLLGPNCVDAYNKNSVANHLALKSDPAVFWINWKKHWHCQK